MTSGSPSAGLSADPGSDPSSSPSVVLSGSPIANDHLPKSGIGKLRFRVGQPQRRVGRPFERACRLSQNPRVMLPRHYSENTLLAFWVRTQRSNYRLQQSITSGRDHGVHASGVSLLYYLVFVVSPQYGLKVCFTNPEFDPLENVFNFQLKILYTAPEFLI
jgi:hypothetical protein